MDDFKTIFVENLIFYRTKKELSQLELSGICDCAKSTISGIESRKNFPSFELLLKIAYALEIHPADLFLRNASKNREEIRDFFAPFFIKVLKINLYFGNRSSIISLSFIDNSLSKKSLISSLFLLAFRKNKSAG